MRVSLYNNSLRIRVYRIQINNISHISNWYWPDIGYFRIGAYPEGFGIGADGVHGTVRMELCTPDSLHVLQPCDRYEPGLAALVVVAVVAVRAAVQRSVADVVARGRLVAAAARGRRRRLKQEKKIPHTIDTRIRQKKNYYNYYTSRIEGFFRVLQPPPTPSAFRILHSESEA